MHKRRNLDCGRPTFFPSAPLTPVQKAKLEELWVRYSQTGSKWGTSYPPDDLTNRLYLTSQFASRDSSATIRAPDTSTGVPDTSPDTAPGINIPSTSSAPGRKRSRSSSPSHASSSNAPKRGKYEPIHVISIADVKRAEQKRADQRAGLIPQPVRPITFKDLEIIEIFDSDEEKAKL